MPYIEMYLKHCLKNDSFDGIAYLTNYCQKNGVNLGSQDISQFKRLLDYHLNTEFNLSKVMIFLKFYAYYYTCRQAHVLSHSDSNYLSDQDLASKLFGYNEDLVDMRELSKYLINSVGSQPIIDPITKEDALWSLIDFFTKDSDFYRVSQQSSNNTIDPSSIAEYLGNQFERKNALERVMKIAIRLDLLPQSECFVDSMLLKLKSYQQ